jgi:hypothetical protein
MSTAVICTVAAATRLARLLRCARFAGCVLLASASAAFAAEDLYDRVGHHQVSNDGIKSHYVTIGQGPAILFVHGFPDFWYT